MVHKFDPQRKALLDSPDRGSIQGITEFLKLFPSQAGLYADLGSGTGYFAFPVARLDGGRWEVIALDTQEKMCREIEERARREGLRNMTVIQSEETLLPLRNSSVDIANLGNAYHELEDRDAYLLEAVRILVRGGRFILIDWEKKESPMGPPVEHRVSSEEALRDLIRAGFGDIRSHAMYPYHYVFSAVR